jgi:hypothetical protein
MEITGRGKIMSTNKQALREELSNPAIGTNAHLRKLALALLDELEAAEKRIAELEAREVNLPKCCVAKVMLLSGFDRQYAEGWCAGNDNAIHEICAAGITVKGA